MAYKGVFVSIKPRKAPCAASAITMGGAPKALDARKFSAGTRIGESYKIRNLKRKLQKTFSTNIF